MIDDAPLGCQTLPAYQSCQVYQHLVVEGEAPDDSLGSQESSCIVEGSIASTARIKRFQKKCGDIWYTCIDIYTYVYIYKYHDTNIIYIYMKIDMICIYIYIHSSPEVNQLLDVSFMSLSFSCSHSTGRVGSVKLEERNTAFFETQVVFWDFWKSLCFLLRVWRFDMYPSKKSLTKTPIYHTGKSLHHGFCS